MASQKSFHSLDDTSSDGEDDAAFDNSMGNLYVEEPLEEAPPRSPEKSAPAPPRAKKQPPRFHFLRAMLALCWTLAQFLFVTAIFSILIGFAAYKSMQYFIAGSNVAAREVKVPNLSGMSLESALVKLQKSKLTLELDKRESNETLDEGLIIRQRPVPGTIVKMRTPVKVTVSLGPSLLPIPNLKGMNYIDAEIKLRQKEFEVGDEAWIHDPKAQKGTVLAQDPPWGSRLPLSAKVNLLISLGPPASEYEMPELAGLTLPEAKALLDKMNLKIQEVNQADRQGVEQGQIIAQSPPAGHGVRPDTPIRITIATGL